MHKVVRFTCWWLPLASALAPTCNLEPLDFIPHPPPKCRVIFSLPIFFTDSSHAQLVLGVIISVNNHLIQYRHAHFQDLGLDTNRTSLKYIYMYLLCHRFLHILWLPLIELVSLMGLVRIPLSWRRTWGWWPSFTWVFFSRHSSTTVNWFGFNCTQQVPVCMLWKQITTNLVQFTVQFEQHTKSPVASNSSAVKQVTHFKWNLCLHLLHLTQGVWSVSKYTNKWLSMSLNWNSNKIPAFALIRQIAQVHL